MFKGFKSKGVLVLSSVVLALSLAACGQKEDTTSGASAAPAASSEATKAPASEAAKLAGQIRIDGSSTVFPISMAIAEEFMADHKGVKVNVSESGSGNGIKKLIAGEIEIADSSRKMKDEEKKQITDKGDDVIEMPIAFDGISVVVNKENTWAKEMTVAELKKIWEKGSKVAKWSDVRAEWPPEPIKLYGPGTASGTFEFFTEKVNGKAKESREDYTPSEDDNVLVKGVSADKYALGYFGYSYYKENEAKLSAIAIKKDDAAAAVAPSHETIENGTYALSREIFIYPLKSLLSKPEIKAFIQYYNSDAGQKLVEEAKYIKLPAAKYQKNLEAVK